ncbi:type II toxin-antitoxin system RelE/ParE family toxin [Enorma massiliensis]|uniref:type II toxin-antitoxin system RelE/ParE family toxin n=1 Tax=Enorma massiliensis TaxID=1472761 RepID=UPI001957BC2B|nr:type II toxin-antitoxin system RelE/ParE family toxin [Enorma massiliensis]
MKVSFQTKKLQKLCEDEREMHKRRPDIERKLRLRIAALKANNTIAELEVNDPLGKWHRLKENRKGQWSGAVSSNERIIIEPLKMASGLSISRRKGGRPRRTLSK